MAEERTVGLARAPQRTTETESKEELQRRMGLARDSISHTVTEIKETVAHQVQAVKDTLDWREQFRKRPWAWSAGALGVGFVAGYSLAGAFKRDDDRLASSYGYSSAGYLASTPGAARREVVSPPSAKSAESQEGPGLVDRFKESAAYESLGKEVSSLGGKLLDELSTTAHQVLLPFLIGKVKEYVGLDRLESSSAVRKGSTSRRTDWTETTRGPRGE